MVKVQFYSLGKDFKIVKTEDFDNVTEAKDNVYHYGISNGYTNIKFVDDEDYQLRVTATTPNGRAGRNIASIELGW